MVEERIVVYIRDNNWSINMHCIFPLFVVGLWNSHYFAVVIVKWSGLLVFYCLFLSGEGFYLYVFLLSSINIKNIEI